MDPAIGIAFYVVTSLGLGEYLHSRRHNHREKLFEAYHRTGAQFMNPGQAGLTLPLSIIDAEATLHQYRVTLNALLRHDRMENVERTRRKIAEYVLFHILHRAIGECANDRDIWIQMYDISRSALKPYEDEDRGCDQFGPLLDGHVHEICENLPGFKAFIDEHRETIINRLLSAYDFRSKPADAGVDPETISFTCAMHIASNTLLNRTVSGTDLDSMLDQLAERYGRQHDKTTLASLYALLYLTWFANEGRTAQACAYFRECALDVLVHMS